MYPYIIHVGIMYGLHWITIYEGPKEDDLLLARTSHIKNTVRIILRHVPLFTIHYHTLLLLSNVDIFEGGIRGLFMNPTAVLSLIANSMMCLFNLTLHKEQYYHIYNAIFKCCKSSS